MNFRTLLLACGILALPASAQTCNVFAIGFVSPGTGFTVYAGQSVKLQFQINQCNSKTPVNSGSVVASFGNGDPQLSLNPQGNGLWQASWTPVNPSTAPVDITVFVSNTTGFDGNQWAGTVAPPAPVLTFDQSTIVFQTTAGGGPVTQTVNVLNNGGAGQNVIVQASGGNWISVTPAAVSVPAGGSAQLQVRVDPTGLAAGAWSGSISAAGASTAHALVSVAVAPPSAPPVLTLNSYNLALSMTQGDPASTKSLIVTNSNPVTSSFTAQSSTSWLTVSPGSATVASASWLPLQIAINPGSLGPGQYSGNVTITSTGGLTMQYAVNLTVIAPAVAPQLAVSYPSAALTGIPGGTPVTQPLTLSNPNGIPFDFTTATDSPWLTVSASSQTVAPDGSVTLTLSANPQTLAPGSYSGKVTIAVTGTQGATPPPIEVGVSFSVANQPPQTLCQYPQLNLTVASPLSQAALTLGVTQLIDVQALDSCGNPLSAGAIVATFSNGDPPLYLARTADGRFSANWTPRTPSFQAVLITITATDLSAPFGAISAHATLNVSLANLSSAPPQFSGLFGGATFAGLNFVSPGELVSIFGTSLADCTNPASLPVPTESCGVQVLLGSTPLPILYASPGQLNVQIPFDAKPVAQEALTIIRDGSLSTATTVTVFSAFPGIFTMNASGSGQGAIINYATGKLADSNSPVSPGGLIVVYCTGLGTVNPAVPTGSPVTTVSSTTSTVTMTIGGQNAQVLFAGMTPGFVGLYQINAVVPAGVSSGNAVPVAIQVAGQSSPASAVTMAVN